MRLERSLAEWAADVDVFPEDARVVARDAFLDITACIIGGSVEPASRAIVEFAKQGGAGPALAMGTDLWLPSPLAALVSGTAAHALDFDDNFAPATTHATAVLAPALFALSHEGTTGEDLVQSYIVGLELQARIGRLVNPAHYEKGWHATSTIGAIGAAGACARLLHLGSDEILAAMSVAFSMAAGSKKQFGSMIKSVHAGLAAKNAVTAALMAKAGVRGDEAPLSGRWGFAELYGAESDVRTSEVNVLTDLGISFAAVTDGLLLKRFPCCGAAHRTLDALVELRQRHELSLDSIQQVEAFIPEFARANLRYTEPNDENEARFSLNYCAARVLQRGYLSLSDMTPAKVRDPLIRAWLPRLVIHSKPGSACDELGENATPALTRVILRNGETFEASVVMPKGSRRSPLSEDEKRKKFLDCCRWAGLEEQAGPLFTAGSSIAEHSRFRDLSERVAQLCAARSAERSN